MAAPVSYGGLGLNGAGLGLMGLGGPQQPQNYSPTVAMPKSALPYIAHLYTNTWQFKRTLGGARLVAGQTSGAFVTKPTLKMTLNGSYQPITLELDAEQPPANLLADPGFEASDTLADVQTNWNLQTPGEFALMTTATDMHSGRRGLKCTRTVVAVNNWNAVKSTPQAVLPGERYTASGWLKTSAGVQSAEFLLWFLDASQALVQNTQVALSGLHGWTFESLTATAPPQAVYVQLVFRAGWWDGVTGANAQTWIDDGRLVLGTDASDPAQNGDLVQLTEQGDNSGVVLFTGIVEQLMDLIDPDSVDSHQLVLTPLSAELADTRFNQQYLTLTDPAQMIRDAVAQTAHLRVAPWSIGDVGTSALFNFNEGFALDVLIQARLMGGLNFWWGVDATGLVWFQPASPASPAAFTIKRGADYNRRKWTRDITNLKNLVKALGGYPGYGTAAGPAAFPITSTYSSGASQKKYGVRAFNPPLVFSTVNDQATLDLIVNTVGLIFDREHNVIELTLPAFSKRLVLCRPGGLTVRLWEPVLDPYPQPGTRGRPGFAGPFVCQDIETDGIVQKLILADVPVTGLKDIQYILDRIVQQSALDALEKPPIWPAPQAGPGWVQIGG